jgi:hypothetical protein
MALERKGKTVRIISILGRVFSQVLHKSLKSDYIFLGIIILFLLYSTGNVSTLHVSKTIWRVTSMLEVVTKLDYSSGKGSRIFYGFHSLQAM